MKNRWIILCAAMLVLLALGYMIGTEPAVTVDIPEDVQRYYMEYIQMAQEDFSAAVYQYCHFEDEEKLALAAEGPEILACEILSWSRLSDSLWKIRTKLTTEMFPSGAYGTNYVGYWDGRYHVMNGYRSIPATLSEGIEIVPDTPSGDDIISEDDVLIPIG